MADCSGHGDVRSVVHVGKSRGTRVVRDVDGADIAQWFDGDVEDDCVRADCAVDGDLVCKRDDPSNSRIVERQQTILVAGKQLDGMVSHIERFADDFADTA